MTLIDLERSVTELLQAAASGDAEANDNLYQAVIGELRIRARHLGANRPELITTPTEVVHDSLAKILRQQKVPQSRRHLIALVSTAMERLIIDRHRQYCDARKRLPPEHQAPWTTRMAVDRGLRTDVVDLVRELNELRLVSPLEGEVIHALFFSGLTWDECVEAFEISRDDLSRARKIGLNWLHRRLTSGDEP